MNFGFRGSNAAETFSQRHQPPRSPSLDSAVLSGSIQPSATGALDDASGGEWVLFSPQLDPEDELLPLDDTDLHSSTHTVNQCDAVLELPGHNGDGSFVEPQPAGQDSRNGDWMDRINSWRLEQSHLLFSEFQQRENTPSVDSNEQRDSIQFWRRLTRHAAQSLGKYLVWDDNVLDALFSPDFSPETSADQQTKPAITHLHRAREHGPPGWEQKAIHGAMPGHHDESGGTFMGMLARILLWKYQSPEPPAPMSAHRHLELLHDSSVPSMPSVPSAPSAYWSDAWEIGTNTSIGTAA